MSGAFFNFRFFQLSKKLLCNRSVIRRKLIITGDNKIFIPNTFIPNTHQVNDKFVVSIININSCRIQIFNRYDSPLFQSVNKFDHWRGIYNHKTLPVGTYFYIIDAISLGGESIKKSGSVSIIK